MSNCVHVLVCMCVYLLLGIPVLHITRGIKVLHHYMNIILVSTCSSGAYGTSQNRVWCRGVGQVLQ